MSEAHAPSYDVLVVGGAGVDIVVRVDALPPPYADSVRVPPIREWVGHTGNGVALGCRALGLTTGFLDFIGDDPHGAMVRERLAEAGVDFHPLISPAGTRRAVNLVSAEGRRMSFFDARESGLPGPPMPRDFYLPHLRGARHVHVSISDFARHLYDDIETLGLPVSTDLHDWDGLTDHHRDFARRSDIVFLSAVGAGERIADVMRAILHDGRAEAVVATSGPAGSYLLTDEDRGHPRHVPAAVPPGPVVDTSGAGDAFASGYLYGHLAGRPPLECARLGAIAGAHACVSEGAHTSLIGAAALDAAAGATVSS